MLRLIAKLYYKHMTKTKFFDLSFPKPQHNFLNTKYDSIR